MNPIKLATLSLTLLLSLSACAALPSGAIFVAILGLPDGVAATVQITGPNDFVRNLGSSQEIRSLPLGTYRITAQPVTVPGMPGFLVEVNGSPAEVTLNESSLVTVIYSEVSVLR
jgi:hypothetical protein